MTANNNLHFGKVTIIGVGLIGGSLALAMREQGMTTEIVGVGRGIENLEEAVGLGIIDSYTTDVREGVRDADLVFLAVPVLSIAGVIETAASALKPGAIITDGGSVKETVLQEVKKVLPEGVHFIAGHPIAGTEFSGAAAAFATLYQGKKCILTPDADTDPEALALVRSIWETVGSNVTEMDTKTHDAILGAVSHLPHVIAYALVNTIAGTNADERSAIDYSGGGFKDFTRIASSSPEMWKDICLMNKTAIVEVIERFQLELDVLKDHIKDGSSEGLKKDFGRAKKVRDTIKN
ncbi:Cyclohexadienyl dehydrogenase [hydrothermal vent metagenome]|uniref:Cyclohexadienyl dehydrogenase n=1 Tax=hydrothermal vent metagenome TaxID=652676 RepID=A0A3B0RJW4_9ZZZZ